MNKDIFFPHIDHRVYKNTFLQNTMVVVSYDEVSEKMLTGDFEDKKTSFFNRFFGIDQSSRNFIREGISISTADKSQNLIFTNRQCITNVNRSVYKTFVESVLPHVFKISTFLRDVVQLREASSIAVRKINVFPVIVDQSMDLSKMTERQNVLRNVLSVDFMQLHHEKEQIQVKGAVSPFGVRNIKNPDGYIYSLKTGILPSPDSATTKFVVLDSTAESPMIINPQDIEARTVVLNDRLFDLFHWVVNGEIIEKMKQE